MATIIHGRIRDGEWRYRLWNTSCDQYEGDEMSEATLRAELLHDYTPREVEYNVPERDIPARLARVHAQGNSYRDTTRVDDINGPWETERCNECGGFHHAYDPREDGDCKQCGEGARDQGHAPPCKGGRNG